jgi:ribosome maturation factor RimP
MSQQQLLDKIKALVTPVIATFGYEWWGCAFAGAGRHSVLRIYIDVPVASSGGSGDSGSVAVDGVSGQSQKRGVNVEDCGYISNEISALLDVEDLIKGSYSLEVSSPGLDRQLFTEEQYRHFIGSDVQVHLSISEQGRKNYRGTLVGVDNGIVKLRIAATTAAGAGVAAATSDQDLAVPLAHIERANIVF